MPSFQPLSSASSSWPPPNPWPGGSIPIDASHAPAPFAPSVLSPRLDLSPFVPPPFSPQIPWNPPPSPTPTVLQPLEPPPYASEAERQQALALEVLAVFLDLILKDTVPLTDQDLTKAFGALLRLSPYVVGEIAGNEAFFVLPPGQDNGRGGNLFLSPPPGGGGIWARVLGAILAVFQRYDTKPLDPKKVQLLQHAIARAGGPPAPSPRLSPPPPPAESSASWGVWGLGAVGLGLWWLSR